MSIEKYNLAHIGLTPALTGTMFMLAASRALRLSRRMHRCYTGEPGAGPWDGCDGGTVTTTTTGSGGMITGSYSYDGSSSGGTASCPCPNAQGPSAIVPLTTTATFRARATIHPTQFPADVRWGAGVDFVTVVLYTRVCGPDTLHS